MNSVKKKGLSISSKKSNVTSEYFLPDFRLFWTVVRGRTAAHSRLPVVGGDEDVDDDDDAVGNDDDDDEDDDDEDDDNGYDDDNMWCPVNNIKH